METNPDIWNQPITPKRRCFMCGEQYDPVLDHNHLEACRDARKP